MDPALRILEKKALGKLGKDKRSINSDNPYLERVPVYKNGRIVKHKTQERPIPAGLSRNDKKILKHVRKRAYWWDMGFRCCCFGVRFGWSAIVGLLPVVGDFADSLVALWLIRKASKVDGGLPKRLYGMMLTNIIIDFAIGLIPVFGDLADVFYRANTRNAWLLDAYLTEKAKALSQGAMQDPDSGKTIKVPPGLQVAPEDRDVEEGMTSATVTTQALPFAVKSARKTPALPGNVAPPPWTGPPGRNLTGPQKAPGIPGRNVQDPREQRGAGRKG